MDPIRKCRVCIVSKISKTMIQSSCRQWKLHYCKASGIAPGATRIFFSLRGAIVEAFFKSLFSTEIKFLSSKKHFYAVLRIFLNVGEQQGLCYWGRGNRRGQSHPRALTVCTQYNNFIYTCSANVFPPSFHVGSHVSFPEQILSETETEI